MEQRRPRPGHRHHARPRGPHRRAARTSCRACPAPMYGTALTLGFLRNKLKEHKLLDVDRPAHRARRRHREVRHFTVEWIHITHSIPDACALAIADARRRDRPHGRLQDRPDACQGAPPDLAPSRRASATRASCCCSATRPTPSRTGTAPANARRRRARRALRGSARAHTHGHLRVATSRACSRPSTPRWTAGASASSSDARCSTTSGRPGARVPANT